MQIVGRTEAKSGLWLLSVEHRAAAARCRLLRGSVGIALPEHELLPQRLSAQGPPSACQPAPPYSPVDTHSWEHITLAHAHIHTLRALAAASLGARCSCSTNIGSMRSGEGARAGASAKGALAEYKGGGRSANRRPIWRAVDRMKLVLGLTSTRRFTCTLLCVRMQFVTQVHVVWAAWSLWWGWQVLEGSLAHSCVCTCTCSSGACRQRLTYFPGPRPGPAQHPGPYSNLLTHLYLSCIDIQLNAQLTCSPGPLPGPAQHQSLLPRGRLAALGGHWAAGAPGAPANP
eukprot:1156662-Pelagomonas_calceolata.AAC.17